MEFEKVLVTGGAGLLGRYVVGELQDRCTVTGLDRTAGVGGGRWLLGDITDIGAVSAAAEDQHAVIHIAAVPNIWSADPETIMRVNVLGTWNVFQAAEAMGVRRVVLCSSDSVVGFTVREGKMEPPLYAPVDLEHPLQATDPYALSKVLGEEIGRSFAARGMEVVVLRPVFVAYPEMADELRVRAEDPVRYRGSMAGGPSAAGGGPLWHHVDPRDAARAFRLALALRQPNVSSSRPRSLSRPSPRSSGSNEFSGERSKYGARRSSARTLSRRSMTWRRHASASGSWPSTNSVT